MNGETNQEHTIHPSVFSFEPYPPQQPIIWNQANPFTNSQFVASTTFFPQNNVPQLSTSLPSFGNTTPPSLSFSNTTPPSFGNTTPPNFGNTTPASFGNRTSASFGNTTSPSFGGTSPVQQHFLGNSLQSPTSNSFPQGFSFGSPQNNQEVVQFPFQISQPNYELGHKTIRCKRKTDSPS